MKVCVPSLSSLAIMLPKRVIQAYKSIFRISINELNLNLTHQDIRPNQTIIRKI